MESAGVLRALPTAKALSTAKHMVASQTVLIILSLRPVIIEQVSASIRAVRGQLSNHRLS